ncbi:MAG: hypothetical protein FVQ77_16570 [Cytophagales bacterium]|nr:hypothetical protein [Cytophagales bacterium]
MESSIFHLNNLSYLIHIPLIIYIAVKLNNIFKSYPLSKFFYYGLGFKLLAGAGVGLLYFYYYGYGDTLLYHYDAVKLNLHAFDDVVSYFHIVVFGDFPNEIIRNQFTSWNQPRVFLMVKIISILDFFTFRNYWVNSLYFSLFSFIGMWYLANTLSRINPNFSTASAIAFLFFPSIVFWSSGILKESIAMGSIGLFLGFGLNSIAQIQGGSRGSGGSEGVFRYAPPAGGAMRIIVSLLCIWLIWKLKYYYLAVLMPLFLSYLITELVSKKVRYLKEKFVYKMLVYCIFVILLSTLATQIHWNLNFTRILDITVDSFHKILEKSNADNCIAFENLQPTLKSFLMNSPKALFSALFRPGIWEARSFLQFIAGLENLLVLLLAILAMYYFVKRGMMEQSAKQIVRVRVPPSTRGQGVAKAFFVMPRQLAGPCAMLKEFGLLEICFLLYTIVLAVFLAFACPNFGTLLRYRVGFYPFFVYLVLMNVPFKWIIRFNK